MTKTKAAAVLFLCAQLLSPAASGAALLTRDLKLFPPGFPRQLRLPRSAPFAVCVSSPGQVAVIDENSGKIAASFASPLESFSVAPDGLSVAVVTGPSAVTLYAPPAWAPVKTLKIDSPRLAEFSPDGRFLTVGALMDKIYVYPLPAWEPRYTLLTGDDGDEELTAMAFSPDTFFFAAATATGMGVVWDVFSWEKIDDFKAPASSVKFTYDGKYLAAAPAVYAVTADNVRKAKLPAGGERFLEAQLLAGRGLLVTAENGALAVFDADTRVSTDPLVSFPAAVSEFAVASDGKFLVAASTPAGTLYITALEEEAGLYGLAVDEGSALAALGKYEAALKKFLEAKELQDTPDINEKIAGAGYRAREKASDAAAAAGRYEAAVSELQAALGYRPDAAGQLKLQKLTAKLAARQDSIKFSAIAAEADALEKKYEYGTAAAKLQEALKVKADARTAARARKLAKLEPAAARYRKEFALGSQALDKRDYGAAVEYFTKALKFLNTREARKCLGEARNNFRR
ncbi:MAG: WD40 repeat domain-containing protein [Elusimicrobia bacterium]|nr:WD40 repeat domain-containing protein [Elusimicrobiota bacterium]